MSQYKVTESFELDGVSQAVDSLVELTDEKAAELAGKVEKVEAPSGDTTPTPPAAEVPPATPAETPAAPSGETPAAPAANEPGFVGGHSMADN